MPRAPGTSRHGSRAQRVSTTVVLFTRDLRVHDNPALHAAVAGAAEVVPLFVLDDGVLARFGAPNRVAFLLDALADLGSRSSSGVVASSFAAATPSRRRSVSPWRPGRLAST